MIKLLFLGNDGNLIKELHKDRRIELIGVVGDSVSNNVKKYFGSSRDFGLRLGIPVISMCDFKGNPLVFIKREFNGATMGFSQGYHYRVPKSVINVFPDGIVNFHQSLLPFYRGRHPLNWAIINNEPFTGITFHFMNQNFDEGDIIFQKKIKISPNDTIITLYNKTIKEGNKAVPRIIDILSSGHNTRSQRGKSSYYAARKPKDGEIISAYPVNRALNMIKALVFPYPGAFVKLGKKIIIIEQAKGIYPRNNKSHFLEKTGLFWHNGGFFFRLSDGLIKIDKIRIGNMIVKPSTALNKDING